MNHLEQLVAEWYEYNGYFVRKNIHVGNLKHGGYECELDIVAFCPNRNHLVHIEPSLDCNIWSKKEERYKKKFDAGQKYIPQLFSALLLPTKIDQIALFTYVSNKHNNSLLAGGRILTTETLFHEIHVFFRNKTINKSMVSEQFPLLRTIQHCVQFFPNKNTFNQSYFILNNRLENL